MSIYSIYEFICTVGVPHNTGSIAFILNEVDQPGFDLETELVYAISIANENQLIALWMVYGGEDYKGWFAHLCRQAEELKLESIGNR